MICRVCEGSGNALDAPSGPEDARAPWKRIVECWPCDGTGVTPSGRFGSAVWVSGLQIPDTQKVADIDVSVVAGSVRCQIPRGSDIT